MSDGLKGAGVEAGRPEVGCHSGQVRDDEGLDEGAGSGSGVQIMAQPEGLPGPLRPTLTLRGRIIGTRSEVCGGGRVMCLFFSDSPCLRQIGVPMQALLLTMEPWAGLSVPLYEIGTAAPPGGGDGI